MPFTGWRRILPATFFGLLLSFIWLRREAWRPAALSLGLAGLELLRIGYQMAELHPYEHLYFSVLPSQAAARLMERDYWGLSFCEGLEWILAHDTASQITVLGSRYHPLYNNTLILSPADPGSALFPHQLYVGTRSLFSILWERKFTLSGQGA